MVAKHAQLRRPRGPGWRKASALAVVLTALYFATLALTVSRSSFSSSSSFSAPQGMPQHRLLQCAAVCSGSCSTVPPSCRRSACARDALLPACGRCFGAANCDKCYSCALAALRRLLPMLGNRPPPRKPQTIFSLRCSTLTLPPPATPPMTNRQTTVAAGTDEGGGAAR